MIVTAIEREVARARGRGVGVNVDTTRATTGATTLQYMTPNETRSMRASGCGEGCSVHVQYLKGLATQSPQLLVVLLVQTSIRHLKDRGEPGTHGTSHAESHKRDVTGSKSAGRGAQRGPERATARPTPVLAPAALLFAGGVGHVRCASGPLGPRYIIIKFK